MAVSIVSFKGPTFSRPARPTRQAIAVTVTSASASLKAITLPAVLWFCPLLLSPPYFHLIEFKALIIDLKRSHGERPLGRTVHEKPSAL